MKECDEPVYYSDVIDPVCRTSPEELFFLIIEARPKTDSDDFGQVGGAFVNCWANADDLRTAERQAVALIEQSGWRPHRFEDWELVSRATYAGREPSDPDELDLREIVDQAFIDGEACVY